MHTIKSKQNHFLIFVSVALILVRLQPEVQGQAKKKQIPYYSIYANQVLHVRLNQELNSEKARIGDRFSATIVDPVYSKNGLLLIPQASSVKGQITNVQRAQKNGKPASLDVVFTSVSLPNGYHRAINGSLTDLESSTGTSDNEGQVVAHKTSHRKAKFIGGGAAGGAVIGAIAGGGKGLAIGAGVGALAGAVTGRVKKGHEVKVKSGTEFGVVLNRTVSFPAYKPA